MMKQPQTAIARNLVLAFIVLFGVASHAQAQGGCITGGGGCAPEIDPSLGSGGFALLGGTILLMRGRRGR